VRCSHLRKKEETISVEEKEDTLSRPNPKNQKTMFRVLVETSIGKKKRPSEKKAYGGG